MCVFTMSKIGYVLLTFCVLLFYQTTFVEGACTYSSLTSSLNDCVVQASGGAQTKWMFPFGTIAEQATFCTTAAQTTLLTCITSVFSVCQVDAKSVKMFGTTGDNLQTAYTNLCANTLITEAQACMSTVTATATTYTTAESTFTSRVDALPATAEYIEICGLVTTLKYTAYTTLLGTTCTTAAHLSVWSTFYDDIIDKYVCTTCSAASANHIAPFIVILTTMILTWLRHNV